MNTYTTQIWDMQLDLDPESIPSPTLAKLKTEFTAENGIDQ